MVSYFVPGTTFDRRSLLNRGGILSAICLKIMLICLIKLEPSESMTLPCLHDVIPQLPVAGTHFEARSIIEAFVRGVTKRGSF